MMQVDVRPEDTPAPLVGRIRSPRDAAHALGAWCLLALIDSVMKLAGFARYHRLVRAWPTVGIASANERPRLLAESCVAVNRARALYIRQVHCLQRAAALVCLLRLRGVRAHLVVGVRKFPFYAHAWAEVDGDVVNDTPSLRTEYGVILEC